MAKSITRRRFIRDAVGLASLAFLAVKSPALISEKAKTIQDKLDEGILCGETFYLDEPIILDIKTTIQNCRFIATKRMPYMVRIESSECQLLDSYFEAKGLADSAIYVGVNCGALSFCDLASS